MRLPVRAVLAAALATAALGAPARAELKSLETPELRLVYFDPTQTYIVPHAARSFENSIHFQMKLWDWTPWEPVTVLLSDFSDMGNATASNVPRNSLIVETAPLSLAYETVTPNERMFWIMNHELVHIATGDRAAASDRRFRHLFHGKVAPDADHPETIGYFYLTTPRYAVPQWYREGIAVFIETWMSGGFGRAQGPWDEMVFRAKVLDDTRFYDPLGLVAEGVKSDFQAGVNNYLYGTRFMSYLAHEYSPEALIEWVSRRDGSKRYYAKQFRAVFGKRLDEAWDDWVRWEHEFQQANLAAIRRYPVTPARDLSQRALGSVSRAYVDPDGRRLYAAVNYPGTVAAVVEMSLDDGSLRHLADVKGPTLYTVTSLAFDPDSGTLFYTSDNTRYRDVRALDPRTGKQRILLRDARIGDLAFDRADGSLWGVRHLNGIATLVRIPAPHTTWNQVRSWPYGEVIHDLDVSPDGSRLALVVDGIDGSHVLRVFSAADLLEGSADPVAELSFGAAMPANFIFAPDGRLLYGSSYYTGVSNLYSFDPATSEMQALTNSETGLFRPIPLAGGDLIAFRYTGQGFVPTRIDRPAPLEDLNAIVFLGQRISEEHPVVKSWAVGSPAAIDLDPLVTYDGRYRTRQIGLESIYPIVEGYKDDAAVGIAANLSDPLSFNRFDLSASYTPNRGLPSDERLHLDLEYKHLGWTTGFTLNDADFYDLFGPTKRSRKGHSLFLSNDRKLIDDAPRELELRVEGNYYGDLERLPSFQNVLATFDTLYDVGATLTYSNRNFSLGAVDYEKGVRAEGNLGANFVDGQTIPYALGSFDVGFQLPLDNSSIWLRTAAGGADGAIDDPFANFYFGGFGNNYVDVRSTKRYREWYAFPGLELNALGGRTFAKTVVEWNLPPLRFARAGTPGLFASWMRTALFVGGIRTNLDRPSARREALDAGVQVDFRLTTLSRLNLTLSFGYAVAWERDADRSDEVMYSLKILD